MAINKKVTFKNRKKGDGSEDECMICGRRKLGENAVLAVFDPEEPPDYAAVYCHACVAGLAAARRR